MNNDSDSEIERDELSALEAASSMDGLSHFVQKEGLSSEGNNKAEKKLLQLPIPPKVLPAFNFFIGQYMYEEDDFRTLIRKMGIFVFGVSGGVAGLSTVPWNFVKFLQHSAIADLLTAISFFILGITFLSCYGLLRIKREVTDNMVLACVLQSLFTWTFVTFCHTAYDEKIIDVTIALIAIVLDCQWLPFVMLYTTFLTWCQTYNRSYESVPGAFMLRYPDTRDSYGIEKMWISYMSFVPMSATMLAAFFSQNEQKRQVLVAKKGINIARKVSAQLRKYNTEKVHDIISEARKDGDEVDKELLSTFEALVENLEKYRPFLPNYLFLDLDSNEEDADSEGKIDDDVSSVQSAKSGKSTHSTYSTTNSMASYASTSIVPVTPSNPNRSTTVAGVATFHGTNHFRGNVALALFNMKPSEWFSQHLSSHRGREDRLDHPRKETAGSFKRLPTLNSSSSSSSSQGRYKPWSPDSQKKRLLDFTDILFESAVASKASLHSVLGDTVQLSWNATHRIAQPESKAAVFLLKIREMAQDMGLGDVTGACCSGTSEVHSCVSVKTKQQALYVQASWLPALEACNNFAKVFKTIVADANVASSSVYDVVTQGVDCLRYLPDAPIIFKTTKRSTGSTTNLAAAQPAPPSSSIEFGLKVGAGSKAYPKLNPNYKTSATPRSRHQEGEVSDSCCSETAPRFSVFLHSELNGTSVSTAAVKHPLDRDAEEGGEQPITQEKLQEQQNDLFRHTIVYELVKMKPQRADDEWMYQLQADEEHHFGGTGGRGTTSQKDKAAKVHDLITKLLLQLASEPSLKKIASLMDLGQGGGAQTASSLGKVSEVSGLHVPAADFPSSTQQQQLNQHHLGVGGGHRSNNVINSSINLFHLPEPMLKQCIAHGSFVPVVDEIRTSLSFCEVDPLENSKSTSAIGTTSVLLSEERGTNALLVKNNS